MAQKAGDEAEDGETMASMNINVRKIGKQNQSRTQVLTESRAFTFSNETRLFSTWIFILIIDFFNF